MQILVVENNLELVFMIKRALRVYEEKHQVDYVYDLKEAQEKLTNNKYGLILLDVCLDGKSGLELLPLENVVITSSIIIDGYPTLQKPFTRKQLINLIEQYATKESR